MVPDCWKRIQKQHVSRVKLRKVHRSKEKIIKLERLFACSFVVVSGYHDSAAAASDKAGMKVSTTKTEVLCLSRNPSQRMLQVSGNALQQVVKFKNLEVVLTSDGRWN